ncbi:MAG TPA: TrbI/VirB10 family protein, partial [Gammaproteobacteria bacterium]|nr:TrbI/VirB10 family protein [Gammaproteobacteria bacterium]
KEGYDKNGFDKNGFDRNGYDKDGYDKDGYDKDGYDRNGCNREGLDRNGVPCYDALGYSADGFNKLGYDKDGFNKEGYDKDGYDRDGFNKDGCNRQGLDREGKPCFNQEGFNVQGYDKDGFDKQGFDKNGFDRDGFDKDGYDKDGFNRDGCNREGVDRNGQPCNGFNIPVVNAQQNAEEAYRKLLAEQQQAREAQMKAQQAVQDRERYLAEQQAMQQAFEALLQSQSTSLVSKWAPPTQVYVRGTHAMPGEGAGIGGEGAGTGENQGTLLYKAGSIIFAVLDTSLNSDEPGPVLATIVQGPLEGSKVMGELQLVEDKLMLKFHLLSSPDLPRSVQMDAVAIDGDTARTALATGVDHHYFLRYGSLFASSFLEGVGEAILAGITQPVIETNDSQVLVVQSATVTATQALLVGVGTVGQKWGEHLGEIFNKKPTVTVDSGTGIGLLLMKDFVINET